MEAVMKFEFIRYEKKDRIAKITLNRPEVMNALHPPCHGELDQALNDFAADPETWVAILTGAGDKAFSAGNDLKWTAEHGVPTLPKTGFAGLTSRFDLVKPLIAAVNGFALGGGFEIALACDLIIAAEHARFGVPEPRVGLMAAAGGVHRLPRMIPQKLAMGMMLTGRHITAAEAARIGIVNEVVPAKDLMAAAERWAREILECSPLSVQASKEAAMRSLHLPLEEAIKTHHEGERRLWASEDAKEGPLAFAQKRKPNWKAR
jgi:enoyl-CoA hydratase/carnithine racemase